jgi:hypothetical protein
VDFTRQPIIESIITPKEGYKLVIRSSKGAGHEEFFVDSVEVVSFGNTFFLRSLERPKSFLVPASDYEILEVRETRMVLKNVGVDSSIKIGGGKEASPPKKEEKAAVQATPKEPAEGDDKSDKRRDRRRQSKRRRGREEGDTKEGQEETENTEKTTNGEPVAPPPPRAPSALLPPPSTLISETIARYKGDHLFKDVFFPKGEEPKDEAQVEEEATASFLRQSDEVEVVSEDPFNITDDEVPLKDDEEIFHVEDITPVEVPEADQVTENPTPTNNHEG